MLDTSSEQEVKNHQLQWVVSGQQGSNQVHEWVATPGLFLRAVCAMTMATAFDLFTPAAL